ncbi:MAG: ATP-binding protein, partial [Bacteroidia bacterium]
MDSKLFISYLIPDRSYISLIKREIHSLVKPRFSEKRTGEIDIIVSELTSNLIKHANGGELLYKFHFEKEEPVLELICIDNGPGMRDVSNSMKDGVSTTNTLGQGIGSIMRLSSFSQIYSQEGWGTIVYLKIFEDPEKKSTPCKVVVRTIAVAKPGEHVSGDGYSLRFSDTKTYVLVGDGL